MASSILSGGSYSSHAGSLRSRGSVNIGNDVEKCTSVWDPYGYYYFLEERVIMNNREVIAGFAPNGERIVLDTGLKHTTAAVIGSGVVGTALGYFIGQYLTKRKQADSITVTELNVLEGAIEKLRKAYDEKQAEILRALEANENTSEAAGVMEKLSALETKLGELLATFGGANTTGLTDEALSTALTNSRTLLLEEMAELLGTGLTESDINDLSSSTKGLSLLGARVRDLFKKAGQTEGATGAVSTLSREDVKALLDEVRGVKDGTDLWTLKLMMDEITRLNSSNAVPLTSKDSAIPWYETLTPEQKENLLKMIEDKGDAVKLKELPKLSSLMGDQKFFTVPGLELDGVESSTAASDINLMFVGGIFGFVENGKIIPLSPTKKIRMLNSASGVASEIAWIPRPTLFTAADFVKSGEEDKVFLDNGVTASYRNSSVTKELLEKAIKNILSEEASALTYVMGMCAYGIAQTAGAGSRNVWNEDKSVMKIHAYWSDRSNKPRLANYETLTKEEKYSLAFLALWSGVLKYKYSAELR